MPRFARVSAAALFVAVSILSPHLHASGPRAVAGTSYFNPAVLGQPLRWNGGKVRYYVDQGALNAAVTHQQATAMVDAAAALWNAVPTAGVTLVDEGTLNEDVSGSNVVAGNQVFAAPADVTPSATNYPVAVVYDADGSVMNALFGAGTSDPTSCQFNGVMTWVDNFSPNATLSHAIILINGLCATTGPRLTMLTFQLERAFGEVLGLGFSQVNAGAATDGMPQGTLGWPVMQPLSGGCGEGGGDCIPDPTLLRLDDIAELNRLYPITASNLAEFPGKVLTAANTVSIVGSVLFGTGAGMQGVNVVARPLDANGNPMNEYTCTFVSGSYFAGQHGDNVIGWSGSNGVPYSEWGSNNAALRGSFDLRYLPLPPGMTQASYQVTFESVDPLYTGNSVVGPYVEGSPTPSGTLKPVSVARLALGQSATVDVTAENSAMGDFQDAVASEGSPSQLPASGMWSSLLGQIGQADWFKFPVRANRSFTIVTQALNEAGQPSESKAMPSIGVWDAFDAVGSPAVGLAPALNGYATGETWLNVASSGADEVRIGISDMRGDGRPDFTYNGWVLYADTVTPARLPAAGGPIVIRGMGFRPQDTVLVNGRSAQVTGISPNEITAIAPRSNGVTGAVNVEVDDLPIFFASAVIPAGISYNAASGDALTLVTAPANTVPVGVPAPFTVAALAPNLAPAAGDTVTFTVVSGSAALGCGQPSCTVTAGGDGVATMTVTPTGSSPAAVQASLTNGASVQTTFSGGTSPQIAALTPALSLAAGASIAWPVQALVLNNGAPASGQTVAWSSAPLVSAAGGSTATSGADGLAGTTLNVAALSDGQQAVSSACLNGTAQCVSFTVVGADPAMATIEALSGTQQSNAASASPAGISLVVHDGNGNPMAGAAVTLYQAVYAWAPPCPTHGRCDQPELLATETESAVSAIDGTVSFTPATVPGVPTNTVGTAATGDAGAVAISIEQHP